MSKPWASREAGDREGIVALMNGLEETPLGLPSSW